jgi:2-desacetyl-2-hydroxyethyl bacteriochlorophyllide A dehydrogenase
MLAVQKAAPEFGLDLTEAEEPRPAPGEVVVEVDAVGICGSDVHVYEWTAGYDWMRPMMPLTIGHEFAGRVVATAPDVTALTPGQRVTVWPSISCGRCRSCAAGRPENCESRTTIGLTRHGAFARHVTAPAGQCFPLPDDLDMELAAMTEPLCVGARAVEVGEVSLGQIVVVLGVGMIGLAIALMARLAGASTVIVAGLNDEVRLATAERLGFQHRVDLARETLADAVKRVVGGPVDRVFEATGAAASIADGLSVLRRGGVLVATGIHAHPVEINLTDLVRNKHQIRGSHGSVRSTWATVLRLLAQSGESFRPLISHRIPLDRTVEGFELNRSKLAVKVMVLPGLT